MTDEQCRAALIAMGDALKLPLLFHSGGGDWSTEKREEWLRITGHESATTRIMCDHIRKVLDEHGY